MQRLHVGDFELTAVSDGLYHLDGGAFFGVVPKSLWQKKVAANEQNLIPVGLNSVVVRTGEHTVLIETGIGNKLAGKASQNLRAAREAAGQPFGRGHFAGRYRYRHQHPSAFRSLWLEHNAAGWQGRAYVSPGEILRSGRRMAVRTPSQRARRDQLHHATTTIRWSPAVRCSCCREIRKLCREFR